MRFFRYSLAVTKGLIKVLIFFNWAPRNATRARNFLFYEPEGLPKSFLRQQPCETFDHRIWAAILISETISVVSGVAASCNIQQVSFFFLSIRFLFPVKKIGQI